MVELAVIPDQVPLMKIFFFESNYKNTSHMLCHLGSTLSTRIRSFGSCCLSAKVSLGYQFMAQYFVLFAACNFLNVSLSSSSLHWPKITSLIIFREEKKMTIVWQMFLFSTIAFAANFDYGFSSTYLNTPVDQFRDYLNTSLDRMGHTMTEKKYNWMWNLILNIWFVGFLIGIWFSPILNDKFGRKVGYLIGNGGALIGAVLRFLAILLWQPILLFLGRLLTSICMAVVYQSCILYLQECSPTQLRGVLSFLSEIAFAVMCIGGTLLGTSEVLGNHLVWLMAVPVPFCALFFTFLFFIPETPKFLLLVKGDRKAATKAIYFYQGTTVNADAILQEIEQEGEEEESTTSAWVLTKELLTTPHLRKALILSCCALQNTVALWSLLLNSTYFLQQMHVPDTLATWTSTIMTVAYTTGTLTGITLIERLGRRLLLLSFTCLNNIMLILYVACAELYQLIDPLKYGCVGALIAYGFTYGAGVGPISWFISSELAPQRYRSLTQSMCYAINTIMVVITTFALLPLYNVIGSFAFLILFSGPSFLAILYLFKFLPETKGKEIHEIVAKLRGKQ